MIEASLWGSAAGTAPQYGPSASPRTYRWAPKPEPSERTGWRDLAACKDANTEIFFPEPGESNLAAKVIKIYCDKCPLAVKQACLEDDLSVEGPRHGVRGGLSAAARQPLATPVFTRPKREACRQGHLYTQENTGRSIRGYRFCKTCKKASQHLRREVA